jgi:hypothetical protein
LAQASELPAVPPANRLLLWFRHPAPHCSIVGRSGTPIEMCEPRETSHRWIQSVTLKSVCRVYVHLVHGQCAGRERLEPASKQDKDQRRSRKSCCRWSPAAHRRAHSDGYLDEFFSRNQEQVVEYSHADRAAVLPCIYRGAIASGGIAYVDAWTGVAGRRRPGRSRASIYLIHSGHGREVIR